MSKHIQPINQTTDELNLERETPLPEIALGQWYWVKTTNHKNEEILRFACVIHIGSNYVGVETPHTDHQSYSSWRVHFDDFFDEMTLEKNPEAVIGNYVNQYRLAGGTAMDKIKEITKRLGLKSGNLVTAKDQTGTGLAVISGSDNINDYKNALVKAEKEELPALFEEVKQAHGEMARWLSASALTMEATLKEMKGSIVEVKDRIFNVSLYAGLTEHVKQCCEGEPADILEKLHLMQRKLYMDEECLLNYSAGGMEFNDVAEFDSWISKPENRDRILPFPRTIVAMQVRRNIKDRRALNLHAFIEFNLKQKDTFTYFYLRNGEQVWRLTIEDFEFDDVIFPNRSVFDPSEPKMMKVEFGKVSKFMSVREFDDMNAKYKEARLLHEVWCKENPDESEYQSPYRRVKENNYVGSDWHAFNISSVYYDDGVEAIASEVKKYNRISLIIQGIFDRSPVLSPHFPVQTWTADGFDKAIKLVYDNENTLYSGEKPDFEAYRAQCNASMTKDSVVTGQLFYWMRREAEKENERNSAKYHYGNYTPPEYYLFKPEGNKGMEFVTKPFGVTKNKATFKWMRERLHEKWGSDSLIEASTTVPISELFNISAYKVGDYKQFFQDPRTRMEYIKWAPLLLAAEDYYAGRIVQTDCFRTLSRNSFHEFQASKILPD